MFDFDVVTGPTPGSAAEPSPPAERMPAPARPSLAQDEARPLSSPVVGNGETTT